MCLKTSITAEKTWTNLLQALKFIVSDRKNVEVFQRLHVFEKADTVIEQRQIL